jgi:hypothetical protein
MVQIGLYNLFVNNYINQTPNYFRKLMVYSIILFCSINIIEFNLIIMKTFDCCHLLLLSLLNPVITSTYISSISSVRALVMYDYKDVCLLRQIPVSRLLVRLSVVRLLLADSSGSVPIKPLPAR